MKHTIVKGKKKLIGDFVYTFLANAILNGVLQLIIYPIITFYLGDSLTGEIMYFVGIIYIFPQAVGSAIGHSRLVIHRTHETTNGDYQGLLILSSTISALICGAFSIIDSKEWYFVLCYFVFAIVYALRTYAVVEYRIKLNFSGYLKYYLIVSVGYLVGFGLFWLIRFWLIIFLVGEIAATIYAFIKLDIFKNVRRVNTYRLIYGNTALIIVSILIRDGVNQFDKIILKQIIGNEMVTHYSVVTMISKVVQLFVNPVNTLILSYLTKKNYKLTQNTFKKYVALGLGAGVAVYGLSILGTWLYVRLFYAQLFNVVIQYNVLANIGVIASFIASLFTAIILSQGYTKTYTILQAVWGVAFVSVGYLLTSRYGIQGMIITTISTNVPKIIAAIIIGYVLTGRSDKTISEE